MAEKCQNCALFKDRYKVQDMKTKWIRSGFLGLCGTKRLITVPAGTMTLGHRTCSLSKTTDWMGKATDPCIVPEEFQQATAEEMRDVS